MGIPWCFGRFWRLVLPEGHSQPRLHLRVGRLARGCEVLADGRRHERASEDRLHKQDNFSAWICIQERYWRCARNACTGSDQYAVAGWACVYVYDPKVKKEDAMTEFKYHNMEVDEKRLVFC